MRIERPSRRVMSGGVVTPDGDVKKGGDVIAVGDDTSGGSGGDVIIGGVWCGSPTSMLARVL